MPKDVKFTQEELHELLDYDPNTGIFTHKINNRHGCFGKKAGCVRGDGYILIGIRKGHFLAHRLAWFYTYGTWPSEMIDHKDGNRQNNRISNLREATHAQNLQNARGRKRGGGLKGAHWHKERGKWKARIAQIHLGYFDSELDAHRAYIAAAKKYFGEFARAA